MEKPDLYICHTAYHLLIALVRAVRAGGGQAVWLSEQIPGAAALAASGRLSGPFAEACVLYESRWPGVAAGPLGHWRNRRGYEAAGAGPALRRGAYRRIYISNDWSVAGRYLQDCRAGYTLCEDTVGGTLDPDQHLLEAQRAAADFAARRRGKGYLYWGDSRFCRTVESEDAAKCTLFPPEKLVTFSKKALLESLTGAEKAAVRRVFLTEPLPDDPAALANATLLLPRSFVLDGLMDQPTQDAIFLAVAKKYADGPLFIKTHPRDETDYHKLFPQAVVLERTMPSEVLNFCLRSAAAARAVMSWKASRTIPNSSFLIPNSFFGGADFMKTVAVIPARYQSSRMPGKPLADILGKPMIWWVYKEAEKCTALDGVLIATDDERIAEACRRYGLRYEMTSADHDTPTGRIWEVSTRVEADLYLQVMGDEPLINAQAFDLILPAALPQDPYYVAVLTNVMTHPADVIDFSNQKVVTNAAREVLMISRSPIPYPKGTLDFEYEKVTGIQLYSRQALDFYHRTPKSALEKAEENDMMRFIENGHTVHAIQSPYKTVSVDTPKDLELVRSVLQKKL